MDAPEINPENHAELTLASDTYDQNWNACSIANTSINNFLDHKLGGNFDWGARYYSWLERHGLQAQTDNGWWSLSAVHMENIQTFIDCVNGGPVGVKCDDLSDIFGPLKMLGLVANTRDGASILDLISKMEPDNSEAA